MANMTLSIPDELYSEMKKHTEIKWSEVARRGIKQQFLEIKGVGSGQEIFQNLPESTREAINQLSKISKNENKKWHKQMKEKSKKLAKSLMKVS